MISEGLTLSIDLTRTQVEAIAQRVAEILRADLAPRELAPSPLLSIPEAAAYLRCKRQRIDDLLSSGRLTRIKDGARTLVSKAEVERHLANDPRCR